jgi:hypothetical protein
MTILDFRRIGKKLAHTQGIERPNKISSFIISAQQQHGKMMPRGGGGGLTTGLGLFPVRQPQQIRQQTVSI